ncbi:hypothetical protein OKA05_06315 [Luteolibacter arcticus]|uniref:Uncharacterized protein n=1 Tax=Luteolibacter arcticus TaxID=1581411 RepID=A0ABT3GFX6_9BACT|nr:hypothetical protein [Luteolibacter arcticus]MCW1922158.1 hypothetical protein [Luteolibacter arcticus]
MSARHPWKAEARQLDHRTVKVSLLAEAPLSFSEVMRLLETDAEFREFFTLSVQQAGYDSYFWEAPPVTFSTADRPFEFVVVEGASLEFLRPDPKPFSGHFAARAGDSVIDFPNLGGDAHLVVPTPVAADWGYYTHLGRFLREAPSSQIDAFWQTLGKCMRHRVSTSPLWLSTAGMGVSWLHFRLDSRPKYYRHKAYATWDS